MAKKTGEARREDSLSRDRIVEAAIGLLDEGGEAGLTFRALSQRLATGPGAIYHHVDDKGKLMAAACDAVVVRTLAAVEDAPTPRTSIRDLAGAVFDAIDAHPWVGSTLTSPEGQTALVRLLERLGGPVRALGVEDAAAWTVVGTLLGYVVGVGGQNAAHGLLARRRGLDRSEFLDALATAWAGLDPDEYPFTRGLAARVRDHDDREDFLAGIDLILKGAVRG